MRADRKDWNLLINLCLVVLKKKFVGKGKQRKSADLGGKTILLGDSEKREQWGKTGYLTKAKSE